METEVIQIESYELSEASNVLHSCKDMEEYKKLITNLDLLGQLDLTSDDQDDKDEENEKECKLPYKEISGKLNRVLNTIYNNGDSLKEYQTTFLPIKVLKGITALKENNIITNVDNLKISVIRSKALKVNNTLDEYMLVYKGKYKTYLIMRWGTQLKTLEELEVIAKEVIDNNMTESANKILEEITTALHNKNNCIEKYLNDEHQYIGGTIKFDGSRY